MSEQTRIILAYTHWLSNANPNFVAEVWKDDPRMVKHFEEKLKDLCLSDASRGYMSYEALCRFDRELSQANQEKLYRYIIANHTDKW